VDTPDSSWRDRVAQRAEIILACWLEEIGPLPGIDPAPWLTPVARDVAAMQLAADAPHAPRPKHPDAEDGMKTDVRRPWRCRLGFHTTVRSQGVVGECARRGCEDWRQMHFGRYVWTRAVTPPRPGSPH
jgi:hypothetical protein